jgi:hypothetical protein
LTGGTMKEGNSTFWVRIVFQVLSTVQYESMTIFRLVLIL